MNLNSDQIEGINVPFFGNRFILRWEADRLLKEKLMRSARLNVPNAVKTKDEIDRLCIVKLRGLPVAVAISWRGINRVLTKDAKGLLIQES